MKRRSVWAIAIVVFTIMTLVFVNADALGRRGWRGQGRHHCGLANYLAHDLKLNDAQRNKIQDIWRTERPAIAARFRELAAENGEMDASSVQDNPDLEKVQAIADREGATIAALLLEKEHLQSKIYRTVLDPEQRTRADELQKKWDSRMDYAADRFVTRSEK